MPQRMLTIIGGFFRWHRRHHVTGVEVGQVPLLIVSILLLWQLDKRIPPTALVEDMQRIAPLWVWMAGLAMTTTLLLVGIVGGYRLLHRWALAGAASWWFTVPLLIWSSNRLTFLSFLSASIYLFIGLSAWWRIAELAMREEAERDE